MLRSVHGGMPARSDSSHTSCTVAVPHARVAAILLCAGGTAGVMRASWA